MEIIWTCKYCNNSYSFSNKKQKGGHLTNCKSNPKRFEISKKISDSHLKERRKLKLICHKCNEEFELELTNNEIEKKRYNKYCLKCSSKRRIHSSDIKNKVIILRKNGKSLSEISIEMNLPKSSISSWTKEIILSEFDKESIKKRTQRGNSAALTWKKRRLSYQELGIKRIKENDPLYIAGCMLYWGEGTKSIANVVIVNTDLAMLKLFIKFLKKFWNVNNDKILFKINAYTDLHSEEEIIKYWSEGLNLPLSSLKKCHWNTKPSSSKLVPSKSGKLEYGTCAIAVHNVAIIQEIYGAIQEFGNFSKEKWLNY